MTPLTQLCCIGISLVEQMETATSFGNSEESDFPCARLKNENNDTPDLLQTKEREFFLTPDLSLSHGKNWIVQQETFSMALYKKYVFHFRIALCSVQANSPESL
ncbi:hypothetical protein NPIL_329711 [Nephila pilipes]|uniref:Uncharacterized protein n=1 Tax=Nephila pilipes TaxID=299642 RepID=A0A8X6P1X2_NEPPI|nr:hypothetical protein NPIL_329711 [Nephila pilipes]